MNRHPLPRRILAGLVLLATTLFSGCIYEVPITLEPTRKVDEQLIGNWYCAKEKETMCVRKLEDSIYIVSWGKDLYRVWHSELDGAPFLSVQDLNRKERKYSYFTYRLEDDGGLTVRWVNEELVSAETQSVAGVQALLRQHEGEPELFLEDVWHFTREARED